ncbi:MAG: hypothetical protein QHC90_26925 [Shinella sp.]|jgi:hypothetical protein|nr:hypothetical protein [Shinella sp.]
MQAALIVMTILGCDDSATQCHYIDTVSQSWRTVAICDAQSEAQINRYQNQSYPVIVAVCESSGDRMTEEVIGPQRPGDKAVASASPPEAETAAPPERKGLTARTLAMIKDALPDAARLKATVSKPVHYIEDGYSWVVHRFRE